MPAAYKQDVKIGTATILCSTDGEVKEYDAEIRKIDLNHEDTNKSLSVFFSIFSIKIPYPLEAS